MASRSSFQSLISVHLQSHRLARVAFVSDQSGTKTLTPFSAHKSHDLSIPAVLWIISLIFPVYYGSTILVLLRPEPLTIRQFSGRFALIFLNFLRRTMSFLSGVSHEPKMHRGNTFRFLFGAVRSRKPLYVIFVLQAVRCRMLPTNTYRYTKGLPLNGNYMKLIFFLQLS